MPNAYAYTFSNGEPPPEVARPELWITVSVLLVIVTAGVCGLVLFLRSPHARCRPRNAEDHDVTMLKVPNGDDPTYGVRDNNNKDIGQNVIKRSLSCHTWITSVSFYRNYLMSFVHRGAGRGCPIWSKGPWPDKSPSPSVSVSLQSSLLLCFFALFVLLCSRVIMSLCLQVKAGMGRCGGELGWGKVWL